MILCHKCSGVLGHNDDENVAGLLSCGCMSGWVRGFEPNLGRLEAITAQIISLEDRLHLYLDQERDQHWINLVEQDIANLKALRVKPA